MKQRGPVVPAGREETVRRMLMEVLAAADPLSAREISAEIGIPEREVGRHLEHIRRSLQRRGGKRLVVVPAECRKCGFVFARRDRLDRPGKCPVCRGESIIEPRFRIG